MELLVRRTTSTASSGTQYRLKDALGVAMGLHEFYRNSDIVGLACFAQTVNVLGAIKTSRTAATLEGSGEVLALYRHQFGTIPIEVTQPAADLDVAAAWTEDRKAITISIVNATEQAADGGGGPWQDRGQGCRDAMGDHRSQSAGAQRAGPLAEPDPREPKNMTYGGKLEAPAYSAELFRLEMK